MALATRATWIYIDIHARLSRFKSLSTDPQISNPPFAIVESQYFIASITSFYTRKYIFPGNVWNLFGWGKARVFRKISAFKSLNVK